MILHIHQHVARGVPQLVAEVAVFLHPGHVEAQIAALGREPRKTQAQCIRTECRNALRELFAGRLLDGRLHLRLHQAGGAFGEQGVEGDAVDDVERIDDIALRFRHLLAVVIADQSSDVDLAKGHLAGEFQAHHDHAGDPEENDVEAGDQHRSGIVGLECLRIVGPALGGERPQRGGEPGIEHILVLAQRHRRIDAVRGARFRLVAGDIPAAVRVVPGRNAMSPPELAADAPILDLVHPFVIHRAPIVGHEADAAVLDGADGRFRQRLDVDEPLIGEQGLEDGVAAIAARHGQLVLLDTLDQPQRFQVRQNPGARKSAVQAAVRGRHRVVERRIRVHDVDQGQRMTLPDFIVVEVVSRGDLDAAAAELRVDIRIADDGNFARSQRQAHPAADQVPVPLIVGVHRDGGVSQQSFRARGRDHEEAAALAQGIAQMPQAARFFFGDHFQIGERRLQHRIPVHQALAAVDQALLIETDEDLRHRPGQAGVHREPIALPIDRSPEPAHLPGDMAAGLLLPSPNTLDEGFASELDPARTFGVQLPFDHHLRRDASVIGAGLPQGVETTHTPIANQSVHDGVLERMAHVQGAGHVRWRDHDGIAGPFTARYEISRRLPTRVDSRLDVGGREGFIHGRIKSPLCRRVDAFPAPT